MTKFLFGAAALALLAASPASAQLLGGSGGGMLGGGLGGTLGGLGGAGGTLGGSFGGNGGLESTLNRVPETTTTATGRTRNSAQADQHVDRRSGKAHASGSGSTDSALDGTTTLGDRALGGSANAAGSGNGSLDAQLVGTDAVRSTSRQAVGTARSTGSEAVGAARNGGGQAVATGRGAGSQALGTTRSTLGSARGYAGSATADASGAASGALSAGSGSLAAAGSAAANGAGAFDIAPGMAVTDAHGKVIGTVRDLRTTSRGAVEQVVMQVGDRTATLPASNFTGSGDVLVSAMGKGEVKKTAKSQSAD